MPAECSDCGREKSHLKYPLEPALPPHPGAPPRCGSVVQSRNRGGPAAAACGREAAGGNLCHSGRSTGTAGTPPNKAVADAEPTAVRCRVGRQGGRETTGKSSAIGSRQRKPLGCGAPSRGHPAARRVQLRRLRLAAVTPAGQSSPSGLCCQRSRRCRQPGASPAPTAAAEASAQTPTRQQALAKSFALLCRRHRLSSSTLTASILKVGFGSVKRLWLIQPMA